MWRRSVAWLVATAVAVAASMDARLFTHNLFLPSPQINCVDYPKISMDGRAGRLFNQGWKLSNLQASNMAVPPTMSAARPFASYLNINEIARRSVGVPVQANHISRRFDRLLPESDDIVKEHAKLVQDINSLRQAVFVATFPEDSRDYEDSIFHEIIETSTTPRPTTTWAPPVRPTRASSFPVLLLGGASQKQPVKMPTLKMPKPTISLVGTSTSSLVKHPYPFASATAALPARKPMKICVTSMPSFFPTTRRPTLWERIINSLIPR